MTGSPLTPTVVKREAYPDEGDKLNLTAFDRKF